MKKSLFLFALLTLSVGLGAQNVGDQFEDAASGLKFEITTVGETNTVKVIPNNYANPTYTIPATVIYQSVTFAVTELGEEAFHFCHDITSLSLPTSIVKIGEWALACCDNLRTLDVAWTNKSQIPTGNNMGGSDGRYMFSITNPTLRVPLGMVLIYLQVPIWNGLKIVSQDPEIGYTFKVDNINYKVTSIGENAEVSVDDNSQYDGTSLLIPQTVYYDDKPYAVTAIEANAFSGCSTLTQVTLHSFTPLSLGENAFSGTSLSVIHVPYKKGETYKSAFGWSAYASMISDELFYIDAQGVQQTCPEEPTIITNANYQVIWDTGWYVVQGNVTLSEGARCEGAVKLILSDEATLTVTTTDEEKAGIRVSETTSSLTIYGQVSQTGKLTATGGKYYGAGIGGRRSYTGRNITINGGVITANGGIKGAGIGGGDEKNGENITINAGQVTAIGGINATSIGGVLYSAYPSSNIFASENCVVREGSSLPPTYLIEHTSSTDLTGKLGRMATIKSSFPITYGDYITTTPNLASGDRLEAGEIVCFTAADRTAEGLAFVGFYSDEECLHSLTSREACLSYATRAPFAPVSVYAKYIEVASITYGEYISVSPEYASGDMVRSGTQLTFTAADRSAEHLNLEGFYSDEACQNRITTGVSGLTYTTTVAKKPISVYVKYIEFVSADYIDTDGEQKNCPQAHLVTSSSLPMVWDKEWYVVLGSDIKLTKGAVCQGNVHLILADGAKLTATGGALQAGVQVSGKETSFTIYGQVNQTGVLEATGGGMSAGIGGEQYSSGSHITINGGIVTAKGGTGCGAGIGGGDQGSGSYITINGGTVTATGTEWSAGIGGGDQGSGSHITINGGKVTASGNLSAGIGGGRESYGSDITINGGEVIAKGGLNAACIGSGYQGSKASNIFVADNLVVKADNTNPPTTEIEHTITTDIASSLAGKRYATIETLTKGDLTLDDFEVDDNITIYNGEAKTATVTFKDGITGAGEITVTYKQSETEVTPINAGEYDIYVSVTEGEKYNALEAIKVSTLTITKATLTADMFTYTAPEDLFSDGNAKTAIVMFESQDKLTGCGEITVKYQKDAVETSPVDAGDYTVSIDVAEGTNYNAATALTKDDWKFTIIDPLPEIKAAAIAEINAAATTAKAEIDGLGVDENAKNDAKAQIDNIAHTAEQTINAATSKDAIDKAKTEAIADIYNVVQTTKNSVLDVAKENAKFDVNEAASEAINQITNNYMVDYVQPIKDTAIAHISAIRDTALVDINASLDKTEVETIKDSALAAIEAIKTKVFEDLYAETILHPVRTNALDQLNKAANNVKQQIAEIVIDEAVKTAAVTAVDSALQSATTVINAAKTEDEITAAKTMTLAAFDAQLEAVNNAVIQLRDTKSASLDTIHNTANAAKTAISEAATREEVYSLRDAAIATIVATDNAATADINATLVLAQVIAIKDSSLAVMETTKLQALADIKAVLDSIAEEEKALPQAKEKALAAVQDSASKAFEVVKYLYVTPYVVYKAQADLDYAESEALSRINYCSIVAEVDGEVEFAFARFAEIVAEAKSMEGESEAKIVPLYSDSTIVTPTEEDVTLTWPIEEDAATYTVIITEEGDTIYVAKFDADGRRTDMGDEEPSMAAARMARAATATADQGYQYTVLGLTTETHYGYKVISQTVDNTVIYQNGGGFMTSTDPTPTGNSSLHHSINSSFKVMENHRFFIIRDGKRYTMMGVEE
ncbi:MAG: leucine-rich repeat protein [Paludibacteraceae bacterium]|nr:leucine-rich repeat protein [Paludibacteraceae bacterium]